MPKNELPSAPQLASQRILYFQGFTRTNYQGVKLPFRGDLHADFPIDYKGSNNSLSKLKTSQNQLARSIDSLDLSDSEDRNQAVEKICEHWGTEHGLKLETAKQVFANSAKLWLHLSIVIANAIQLDGLDKSLQHPDTSQVSNQLANLLDIDFQIPAPPDNLWQQAHILLANFYSTYDTQLRKIKANPICLP